MRFFYVVVVIVLWTPYRSNAQSGPAGVGTSTNNVLWLKADAGTSTTTDGSAISSWNDQSGNSIHVSQSTSAQQPTYKATLMNGMPAVEFDNSTTAGQNDLFTAPDNTLLDNTAGYTAFSVVRMKGLSGNAQCIFSKRTTIDTDEAFMLFFYTGNNLYLDVDGLADRFNTSNTYTTNTNYLVGFNYDGSLASAQRSKITEGDSVRRISGEASVTVGDKPSPLVIGATHSGDNRPFNGYISELILYRTALNQAQRTIVYNYLSAKYDIALLRNDKYTGDDASRGHFDRDVAGIGQEASGSNTTFNASATKGLSLTAISGLDNGDYALAGHRYPFNWQNTTDVGGMTGTNNARWERNWYIDVTNAATSLGMDFEFDFSDAGISGSPAGSVSNYVLLYRATNSGNWTELATANSIPGDRVKFNGYTLVNDGYYTVGTKNYTVSPLPVSLLSFTATKEMNKTLLQWETITETNNNYFTLERSGDAVNYTKIATLNSKSLTGNSNSSLLYNFTDETPLWGLNYYRLSQTDHNGEEKVFPPVSVLLEKDKNISFVLYPNPNKGAFSVDFTGIENNHEIRVELFDQLGRSVYSQSFFNEDRDNGSFQLIPEHPLEAAAYNVKITVEGISYYLTTIVQ
ncbi:MAG: hypothetical protein K0S33_1505 [Bacteroidetes bacterium]|jgi:hypothetical protein|nr:hypothetical protein [Bacteroidota bacterium]